MKNFKAFAGSTSSRCEETVTAEMLSFFSQTICSSDPSCPTYWTRFRKGEFELLDRINLPLSQVLHAEQEYEFQEMPRVGTTYEYRTTLKEVLEKRSRDSILHFLIFETQITCGRESSAVAVARSTILHREKLPAAEVRS